MISELLLGARLKVSSMEPLLTRSRLRKDGSPEDTAGNSWEWERGGKQEPCQIPTLETHTQGHACGCGWAVSKEIQGACTQLNQHPRSRELKEATV